MLTRTIVTAGLLAGSGLAMPMSFGLQNVDLAPVYSRVYSGISTYFAAQGLSEDIQKLDDDTVKIGGVVDKFNGDVNDALAIQTESAKLLDDIKAAIANVGKMDKISLKQSMALLPIFSKFTPDTKATLGKLKAKKPLFDKLGVTSVVSESLIEQQSFGSKLNDAIYAKLPGIAKTVAKSQYTPIDNALKDAIKTFPGGAAEGAGAEGGDAAPAAGAAPAADAGADDS